MTIVDKIKSSIQSAVLVDYGRVDDQGNTILDPIEVYYHDDATLNDMTRGMRFPCAFFLLLVNGRPLTEGGQIKERVSAAVFFVEPSQFDFDAEENEVIIDRCKKRAFAWIAALLGGDLYLKLDNISNSSRTYNRYDDILTGYAVNVDIVELVGVCQ